MFVLYLRHHLLPIQLAVSARLGHWLQFLLGVYLLQCHCAKQRPHPFFLFFFHGSIAKIPRAEVM